MVTACNYPVREGVEVKTHSKRVIHLRQILLELLLARCPDIPFVKNLAKELGVETSRFKTTQGGNDCILCGLCVRTCNEMVGARAIGFSSRGTQKKVSTPFEVDSDQCVACGACEYICPTGAIKMEMDRIRKIRLSNTGANRYCRYMLLGMVDFMLCSNGFECWHCEVDQMMVDRFAPHPVFAIKPGKRDNPLLIKGFHFYPELFYSREHVWAKPMDQWVRLGLDEMASLFAIEADSIRLPPPNSPMKKGQSFIEIISNGKRVEIPSPISGTVTVVNRDVEEAPNLIWKDPYRRGWLMMVNPSDPQEISDFYRAEKARDWFTKQAENLNRFLSKQTSLLLKKDSLLYELLDGDILHNHWDQLRDILWKWD